MLDRLETLAALERFQTMGRVAAHLRVGQSAVSKRISALEDELGAELVEPDGRRVRLTPAAVRLLRRARPLVAELREALREEVRGPAASHGEIVLAVSESILTSWAPPLLAGVREELPDLDVTLATHRSPVAVEGVRAGEYQLALVAGTWRGDGDLKSASLPDEPLVLVTAPGTRPRLRRGLVLPVLSIERASATGRALEPQLRALSRERGIDLVVASELQSYAALVQLARAGLAHALAPAALARALGATDDEVLSIPSPGLTRPVRLVGRRRALGRPHVAAFVEALVRRTHEASARDGRASR